MIDSKTTKAPRAAYCTGLDVDLWAMAPHATGMKAPSTMSHAHRIPTRMSAMPVVKCSTSSSVNAMMAPMRCW